MNMKSIIETKSTELLNEKIQKNTLYKVIYINQSLY